MMTKTYTSGKQALITEKRAAEAICKAFNKMPPVGGKQGSPPILRIIDVLSEETSIDRGAFLDGFDKYGGIRSLNFLPLDAVLRVWASVAKELGYIVPSKVFALLAIEEEVVRFGVEIANTDKLAAKYGLPEDEVNAARARGIRALYMSNFESEMGFADRYLPCAAHYEKPLKLAESHLSSKEVQRAAFGMLTGHIFGQEFHDADEIADKYSFPPERVRVAAALALKRLMGVHPESVDKQEKIASAYGLSEKEVSDCAAKACKMLIQNYGSHYDVIEDFVERHRLYGNKELTELRWVRVEHCEFLIHHGRYDEAQKIAEEYDMGRQLAIILALRE
ncbi:MAG: hypothetical protein WC861_04610 [Candidatus Micrarchaeia archaeon]|jgi:hypothetical protein